MPNDALREYHPFRSAEAKARYAALYEARAAAWPIPAERRMVRTAEGETCVWVSGPADAPPLVLLPGAWGHALLWPPELIEALAERFRTCYVDNICDVGMSVCARPLRSAAEFMAWLDGLFDALGLTGGISLMGLSRGGWLTGEYLLHAPERLNGAVLLSPALVAGKPSLRSMGGVQYTLSTLIAPSKWSVTGMMRNLMPYFAKADPERFDAYVTETAIALQSFDRSKVCGIGGPRTFSDEELRSIGVPVLFMTGAEETMSSARTTAERIAKVAPAFETAVFPACGHDLVDMHTAEVARTMTAFLLGEDTAEAPAATRR